MKFALISLLAILAAVGLFLVIPMTVVVVPFLIIPAFVLYVMYRYFDEKQDTYTKFGAFQKKSNKQSRRNLKQGQSVMKENQTTEVRSSFENGEWHAGREVPIEFRERIENLFEKFPSDAVSTLKISRFGERWLLRAMITSVHAKFTAIGVSAEMKEAIDSIETQLMSQLEHWRKGRFSETRWMKNVEAQFLSQIAEDFSAEGPTQVLIVDDDIDAALLVDSVFRKKGCETRLALTVQEARQMIAQMQADLIILDWKLSRDVNADQVLEESIAKFEAKHDVGVRKHPKVVTFSSLSGSEIHFPQSKFFEHVDHWKKPINYTDLTNKSSGVLAVAAF